MHNDQNSPWTPPAGYARVKSTLDGISVYAPLAQVTTEGQPTEFKCPNCGANTAYDIEAAGVACEHCGYSAQTKSQVVGQGAQTFEFTLSTLNQASQGWGLARPQLHCDSCGADLSIPEDALTATCPFCASNQVNIRTAPDDHFRPRFLIPFKVQMDAVRARTAEWLGKGWFHPGELSRSAVLAQFTGVYLPYWTFDATITADWKAQVGYERQERYYDSGDKTWKTRTVIDWRWEDGRVGLDLRDLLVSGTNRVSQTILERISSFDLSGLCEYKPDFLAGWQAQVYNIPLTSAWEQGKAVMRERAKGACYDDISTSHVRNFSMVADFDDEAWRFILLPVYIAAYKFESRVFQVMVNGQSGAVAGQKPVAWWKVWLAVGVLLSPGVVLGLIGLMTLLLGGVGAAFLVAAFIALVIGGIFSVIIYRSAVKSEAG